MLSPAPLVPPTKTDTSVPALSCSSRPAKAVPARLTTSTMSPVAAGVTVVFGAVPVDVQPMFAADAPYDIVAVDSSVLEKASDHSTAHTPDLATVPTAVAVITNELTVCA